MSLWIWNKQQKILIMITCGLLAVLLAFCLILQAFYVNPYQVRITYQTVTSPALPDDMDGMTAVYISDLEYSASSSAAHTAEVFDAIARIQPDLFLFGGDLFNWFEEPSESSLQQVTAWLQSIQAPLGKFAVLGEQDVYNDEHKALVLEVFQQAQIEVLRNDSLPLYNAGGHPIQLVGLNPKAEPEKALDGIRPEDFCLVLSHYPDHLLLPSLENLGDYGLAGHAHSTEVLIPFVSSGTSIWGALDLNRARQLDLPFDYTLTSGLGCLQSRARWNSPVEIVCLIFQTQTETEM